MNRFVILFLGISFQGYASCEEENPLKNDLVQKIKGIENHLSNIDKQIAEIEAQKNKFSTNGQCGDSLQKQQALASRAYSLSTQYDELSHDLDMLKEDLTSGIYERRRPTFPFLTDGSSTDGNSNEKPKISLEKKCADALSCVSLERKSIQADRDRLLTMPLKSDGARKWLANLPLKAKSDEVLKGLNNLERKIQNNRLPATQREKLADWANHPGFHSNVEEYFKLRDSLFKAFERLLTPSFLTGGAKEQQDLKTVFEVFSHLSFGLDTFQWEEWRYWNYVDNLLIPVFDRLPKTGDPRPRMILLNTIEGTSRNVALTYDDCDFNPQEHFNIVRLFIQKTRNWFIRNAHLLAQRALFKPGAVFKRYKEFFSFGQKYAEKLCRLNGKQIQKFLKNEGFQSYSYATNTAYFHPDGNYCIRLKNTPNNKGQYGFSIGLLENDPYYQDYKGNWKLRRGELYFQNPTYGRNNEILKFVPCFGGFCVPAAFDHTVPATALWGGFSRDRKQYMALAHMKSSAS